MTFVRSNHTCQEDVSNIMGVICGYPQQEKTEKELAKAEREHLTGLGVSKKGK